NHSFRHEPWIDTYPDPEVADELKSAHEAISGATGHEPVGFRGPGFSISPAVLGTLASMGYQYDASTLPTWIGPIARRYYFRSTRLSPAQIEERRALFGTITDVAKPNTAYAWHTGAGPLSELPVTTMPVARTPIHISYLLYLSGYSMVAALAYFEAALLACRLRRQGPSILLHPLDLLGGDEVADLQFFPGMQLAGALKRERTARFVARLANRFEIVPCRDHLQSVEPHRRHRTP
ncbi:MAG: polysaccharide deacetylase family protein, partial [bacterium]|nr:polysaccharide deacetylase family protein [bacterium]